MKKLGELLSAYSSELPITPRHEQWLRTNHNASYTELAREFLGKEVGKPQRDRTRTFSASGAGACPRKRQLAYIGVPQTNHPSTHLVSIFHNGTWTHLRWQLAGLSAGWLAQAEVPVRDDLMMLSGTLDGITDTGIGVEIKSINSNGFNRVMTYGIKAEHKAQADAYLMMTQLPGFSFIYENKDTQDYKEIFYPRDEQALEARRAEQRVIVDATHRKELMPVKPACVEGEGREFLQCPFRGVCRDIKDWAHAEYKKETPCASGERTLRLRRTSSSPLD